MNLIRISTLIVLVYVISINFSYSDNTHSSDSIPSSWITSLAFGEDNSNTPTEYSVYVNAKHGFTLEYPTYWNYDEGEWSNPVNGIELLVLNSNDDTRIIFAKKSDDVEFRNLPEQRYLNKMMKNEENFCHMLTMDKNYWTCSNFEPILSAVIPDPKYPAYTVSYTYTAEFNDGTSEKYLTSKIQIPDHGNTWRIIVDELEAKILNHPEETASILNSFTILTESKDMISPTSEDVQKGGGCLIATATYGTELAPQVQLLREIRDNSLLQTASGTSFMSTFNDFYYSFSPTIADWERESPVFKEVVKIAITPMITTLSLMDYAETESDVMSIGISLIILNLGMYVGLPVFGIIGFRKIIA